MGCGRSLTLPNIACCLSKRFLTNRIGAGGAKKVEHTRTDQEPVQRRSQKASHQHRCGRVEQFVAGRVTLRLIVAGSEAPSDRSREGEAPSEPRGGINSNMEALRECQALLDILLVD